MRIFATALVVLLIASVVLRAQRGPVVQTPWDGVFTIEQAERGRWGYSEHCAICHGADLKGVPEPSRYPGLPDLTPPLVGDQFARNWDGTSLGDLVERIRISMPQRSPGSLDRATVTVIVAFILHTSGYPSGVSELSPHPADQVMIFFKKRRP